MITGFVDGLIVGILGTIIVTKIVFAKKISDTEKYIEEDFGKFMEFVVEQAAKSGNLSKIEVCDEDHNVIKTFDSDEAFKFKIDDIEEVIKENEKEEE